MQQGIFGECAQCGSDIETKRLWPLRPTSLAKPFSHHRTIEKAWWRWMFVVYEWETSGSGGRWLTQLYPEELAKEHGAPNWIILVRSSAG